MAIGIYQAWSVIHKSTLQYVRKNGMNVRFRSKQDAKDFKLRYGLSPIEYEPRKRLILISKGRKMRYTIYKGVKQ